MAFRTMLFLFCLIFTFDSAAGQPPPKPKPPTPKPSPAPPGPSRSPDRPQQMDRVLYLMGTVVMADGSPIPGNLSVALECNASTVQKSNIGPGGQFSFEIGGNRPQMMADASVSGWGGVEVANTADPMAGFGSGISEAGLGRIDLNSCQIRLPLEPGFHSNPIRLSTRSVFDNPDVGTLLVHRLDASQGTTISLQSLSAPGKARKAYQRAVNELSKKKAKPEKAVQQLEKSIELFPDFAEAWNLLGRVRLGTQDEEGARAAFRRAIQADQKYLLPYLNLAHLEVNRRRWKEAAELTGTLIELNPYIDESHYLNGVARYYLGDLDASHTSFLQVRKNPDSAFLDQTYLFTGLIFGQQGKIRESAADLRRFVHSKIAETMDPELRKRIHLQLAEWEQKGLIDPEAPDNH